MKRILLLTALFIAARMSAQTCPSTSGATQLATGVTTTSYTDTTVTDGQSYDYMVEAVNSFGGFSCSNVVLNIAIPSTGAHTATLSWTASATTGVSYSIFRETSPAPPTNLTTTVN